MKLYPEEVTDRFGRSGVDEKENTIPIKMGYVEYIGGPFVIEPRFDHAQEFSDKIAPGYGPLALVKENGKWGIIRPDGTYFVKPEFDYIHNFSEDFAAVGIDRGYYVDWGFIRTNGSFLLAPGFEYVKDFHRGYAEVRATNKIRGFIQPDGSYRLKTLEEVEKKVKKESDYDNVMIVGKNLNGKTGYIDTNGVWYDKKPKKSI